MREGQNLFDRYSFLEVVIVLQIVQAKEVDEVWIFQSSRKIDEKDNKFELQDDLVLHYKFHPSDYIQTRGRVSFKRARMMYDVNLGF